MTFLKMTPFKKKRFYVVVGSLICLSLSAFLGAQTFRNQLVFYYSPYEITNVQLVKGKTLRIGGLVEKGSLTQQVIDQTPHIHFVVTDEKARIHVTHIGLLPDLFREGQGVVVEGIFLDASTSKTGLPIFKAQTILTKHDENYMPPEVAKGLDAASKQATMKTMEKS